MENGSISVRTDGISERLLTEAAYDIYKDCMYAPSYDKYICRMRTYLANPDVHIFVCERGGTLAGILVLELFGDDSCEILGIAVSGAHRQKGVGSAMLTAAAKTPGLRRITAETDDDAVGFYRSAGFDCQGETVRYPDGDCIRYRCVMTV